MKLHELKQKTKRIALIPAAACVLSVVSVAAYAGGGVLQGTVFSTDASDADSSADITCTGEVTNETDNAYGMHDYTVEIICTIPETCTDSSIALTSIGAALSGALLEYGTGVSIYPGDRIELSVSIVNASGTAYAYEDSSFSISTVDWSDYEDYTQAEDGATGFDGQIIPEELTAYRTANAALSALYGQTDASYAYAEGRASDTALAALLTEAGYADGIDDLDAYYLDYYNAQNGTDYTLLSQLPDSYVQTLTGGTAAVSEGTNSTRSKISESNAALNALYYDYFYSACVSFSGELYDLSSTTPDTAHSIAAHMQAQADGTPLVEDALQESLGAIGAGDTATWSGTWLQFSQALIGNAYQDYVYALDAGLVLTAQSAEDTDTDNNSDSSSGDTGTGSDDTSASDDSDTDSTNASSSDDSGTDSTDTASSDSSDTASSAQTGDASGLIAWLCILWAAAAALTLILRRRKKAAR